MDDHNNLCHALSSIKDGWRAIWWETWVFSFVLVVWDQCISLSVVLCVCLVGKRWHANTTDVLLHTVLSSLLAAWPIRHHNGGAAKRLLNKLAWEFRIWTWQLMRCIPCRCHQNMHKNTKIINGSCNNSLSTMQVLNAMDFLCMLSRSLDL